VIALLHAFWKGASHGLPRKRSLVFVTILFALTASAQWQPSGATTGPIHYSNGNVGIGPGATAPASLLHLSGTNGVAAITFATPGNQRFRFQTIPGTPNWGALTLNTDYSAGWNLDDTSVNGWFLKLDTRAGNASHELNGLWLYRVPPGSNPHTDEYAVFGVSSGGAYLRDRLTIGTTTSTGGMTLTVGGQTHLAGNVTVTGNIVASGSITGVTVLGATYQDVAEWVPATTEMDAGTVVVLNRDRHNEVMPSQRMYDTAVAGVVSAQPGVILGVPGEAKEQIATTGRVRVHADATRGAIRVGDLLVTSDRPGFAMKSQPVDLGGVQFHRPGTLIGKALEPLPHGQGDILVLLSLQ
jgi:hypothetical protein